MKKIIPILLLLLLGFACSENEKSEMKDNSEETEKASTDLGDGAYGYEKIDKENAMELDALYQKVVDSKDPIEAKSKGKITQVCKHSGCWVMLQTDQGKEIIVNFKNEFSIPRSGVVGKTIYFKGKSQKEVYSVEDLKEMAMKDGKTTGEIESINEPEYDISFIADGVLISE
jgi:hypothetical protein